MLMLPMKMPPMMVMVETMMAMMSMDSWRYY